jgi:hypothetical protein
VAYHAAVFPRQISHRRTRRPADFCERLAGFQPKACCQEFRDAPHRRGEAPPRDTQATGQAVFQLNEEETELSYRLILANIDNVVAAHIHPGVTGVNGPVVAFLAGDFPPGGGRVSGVLGEGTITSANLVGPLAGRDLSVLVAAMRSGGTYVNVHTNDGIDPTNTGPGDFPGGEIRGQIRTAGPAQLGLGPRAGLESPARPEGRPTGMSLYACVAGLRAAQDSTILSTL